MTVALATYPPGAYPVPDGRGRWRVTLHSRTFGIPSAGAMPTWRTTMLVELVGARGRRLEQSWDQAAQFTFTLNGHAPEAAAVLELQTDVYVWRWDDTQGVDVCMFRGPVTQAEDQITEQSHVVTFTAHDYLSMLARRLVTRATPWTFTQQSQDVIARAIVADAVAITTATGGGIDMRPGSGIPLLTAWCNPDGSARADAAVLRDRSYAGGSIHADLLDQLAKVDGGFDYDVIPEPRVPAAGLGAPAASNPVQPGVDAVRIFYPRQGVQRDDMMLLYGGNVATITRTISSADYTNYVRSIGNKASTDPNAAQLFAEVWNTDANATTQNGLGLWMFGDNASDVSIQATLNAHAQGLLNTMGLLVPSYTIGLRPGWYVFGNPNMGDTVPLRIQSGRLNVNTSVRIVGLTFDIGDDGQEDIALTVGRPALTIGKIVTAIGRDVDALARR